MAYCYIVLDANLELDIRLLDTIKSNVYFSIHFVFMDYLHKYGNKSLI